MLNPLLLPRPAPPAPLSVLEAKLAKQADEIGNEAREPIGRNGRKFTQDEDEEGGAESDESEDGSGI